MGKGTHSSCIFCKIVRRELPASIVYEDDKVMVFPPLKPVNKGHMLVVSKKHLTYLADLNDNTAAHIIKVAKKIASAIRKSKYRCEGINLFVADGEAAEQEVLHFHLHVYPRFKAEGFGFKYDVSKHFIKMERKELDEIADEVKKHL